MLIDLSEATIKQLAVACYDLAEKLEGEEAVKLNRLSDHLMRVLNYGPKDAP